MQDTQAQQPFDRTIRLLLVGDDDNGFTRLRDLLMRDMGERLHLDRARSREEAFTRLEGEKYDLVLCDLKSNDEAAPSWADQLPADAPRSPVILLGDNDVTVEALIQAVACDCMSGCNRRRVCMALPILSAIHVYRKQRQHQNSDEMLRKLRRTVEQSPDLVMITDSSESWNTSTPPSRL